MLFNERYRLITGNLEKFNEALLGKEPLFEVDSELSVPDIILIPTCHQIYNMIVHTIKDFIER